MATQISPGVSTFPYDFKGGEIHCLKLGSFRADAQAFLDILRAEEEFMSQPNRCLKIWIDLYGTELTDTLLLELARALTRAHAHIIKLALVGCPWQARRRLQRLNKQPGIALPQPVRFFHDPELAKTWLVSEPV